MSKFLPTTCDAKALWLNSLATQCVIPRAALIIKTRIGCIVAFDLYPVRYVKNTTLDRALVNGLNSDFAKYRNVFKEIKLVDLISLWSFAHSLDDQVQLTHASYSFVPNTWQHEQSDWIIALICVPNDVIETFQVKQVVLTEIWLKSTTVFLRIEMLGKWKMERAVVWLEKLNILPLLTWTTM